MKWPWSKKTSECKNCAQMQETLVRLNNIDFKASKTDPMVLDAAFEGAAVKLFAASAAHWFRESGGPNFITMDMSDPTTGDHFALTLQKAGRLTPAQKLAELKKQMSLIRAYVAAGSYPQALVALDTSLQVPDAPQMPITQDPDRYAP